jgi:homoprotocatechuate degradation regulator HpaR
MLLLAAREAVTQRFRHLSAALGLTEQQWRVIRALSEVDCLEIIALSARCRLHAASLSRILPRLNKIGLIARRSDAADHRRVIVSLTPRGRRMLEQVIPESARIYQQIARDVGPERLDQVYALLEEFVRLLGRGRAGRNAAATPRGAACAAQDTAQGIAQASGTMRRAFARLPRHHRPRFQHGVAHGNAGEGRAFLEP